MFNLSKKLQKLITESTDYYYGYTYEFMFSYSEQSFFGFLIVILFTRQQNAQRPRSNLEFLRKFQRSWWAENPKLSDPNLWMATAFLEFISSFRTEFPWLPDSSFSWENTISDVLWATGNFLDKLKFFGHVNIRLLSILA